jgi:hypothetical protein
MKLECRVTRVSGDGETVTVSLDGRQHHDAEWRRDGDQQIQVTGSAKVKRAFYLGRRVTITVQPR